MAKPTINGQFREVDAPADMPPISALEGRVVATIEAIGATAPGRKVKQAWLDLEVIQCGYRQSGQIMSAAALLATTPDPDDADIDAAMAGNSAGVRPGLRRRDRRHRQLCHRPLRSQAVEHFAQAGRRAKKAAS